MKTDEFEKWVDIPDMSKEEFEIVEKAKEHMIQAMFVSPSMLGSKKDIIKTIAQTAVDLYELENKDD